MDFARHYLEKLLNMEVPIPAATADGLGNVMTNETPKDKAAPGGQQEPDPDMRAQARRRARRQLYGVTVGALTAAAFALGWMGSTLADRLRRNQSSWHRSPKLDRHAAIASRHRHLETRHRPT